MSKSAHVQGAFLCTILIQSQAGAPSGCSARLTYQAFFHFVLDNITFFKLNYYITCLICCVAQLRH